MINKRNKTVFIVGSPRSGTTILGEILDNHPDISQWYEPYFIWDKYFRSAVNDERNEEDAIPKVCRQIHGDFLNFRRKKKSPVIVDKSPRNSLKIPFIKKIFPDAYFAHILRDGRDVTLSIHKEWIRRAKIVEGASSDGKFDYKNAFEVMLEWLNRQPFMFDKLRALWFETHMHMFDKTKHLNRFRWDGRLGWGPRFKGWREYLEAHSIIEFNAMQWVTCVEAIRRDWSLIPEDNKIEIRYEDLLRDTVGTLSSVLKKFELEPSQIFFENLPEIKKHNFNKWQKEFSAKEIQVTKPILSYLVSELGYAKSNDW
jgi:hypothetical protein